MSAKLRAELKVFTLRDYAVTQLLHVSNIFKISSSDWLNYRKPLTQHFGRCDFRVFMFCRVMLGHYSQVRWESKSVLDSNISAKIITIG